MSFHSRNAPPAYDWDAGSTRAWSLVPDGTSEYTGCMAREYPSSDELIRRAKESARLSDQDVLSKVDQDLSEHGLSIGGVDFSMADDEPATPAPVVPPSAPAPPAGSMRQPGTPGRMRRVESLHQEHLQVPSRRSRGASGPAPASDVSSGSEQRSGGGVRLLGKAVLAFVAVVWLLLLIGAPSSATPIGELLAGGVVITFIPFLFGVLLLRAGRNRT